MHTCILNSNFEIHMPMIKPILQLGNEILKKQSLLIRDFHAEDLRSINEDLADTLYDAQKRFGYGRGIAAPQIGELKRIVLIDTPSYKGPLINPKIIGSSDKKFEVWDNCFSFNLAFFVLIDRHYSINVEFFDQEGKKQMIKTEDKLSELLHARAHLTSKDCGIYS